MFTRCLANTASGKRCKKSSTVFRSFSKDSKWVQFCHMHCKNIHLIKQKIEPTIEDLKLQIKTIAYKDDIRINDIFSLYKDIKESKVMKDFDLTRELLTLKATHPETRYLDNSIENFMNYLRSRLNEFGKTEGKGLEKIAFVNMAIDLLIIYTLNSIHETNSVLLSKVEIIANIRTLKGSLSAKERFLNQWEENNMNKLRVKLLCKIPSLPNDICNYVIAQYL